MRNKTLVRVVTLLLVALMVLTTFAPAFTAYAAALLTVTGTTGCDASGTPDASVFTQEEKYEFQVVSDSGSDSVLILKCTAPTDVDTTSAKISGREIEFGGLTITKKDEAAEDGVWENSNTFSITIGRVQTDDEPIVTSAYVDDSRIRKGESVNLVATIVDINYSGSKTVTESAVVFQQGDFRPGTRNHTATISKVDNKEFLTFTVQINDLVYTGTGNTITFNLVYVVDGQRYNRPFTVRVDGCVPYVDSGNDNTDDDDEDVELDPLTPHIIVSQYDYGDAQVSAGNTIDLALTISNTSRHYDLDNIVMKITTGDGFAITSSSNTYYFDSLNVNENITKTISLQASPSAEAQSYPINIEFSFQYIANDKRVSGTSSESISIPVTQLDRFSVNEIQTPTSIYVGDEYEVSVNFVNLGKNVVYNVTAQLEGNMQNSGERNFIGNVASGTEDSADFYITPTQAGTIEGQIVISYEDSNMNVKQVSKPFTIQVDEYPVYDTGFDDMPVIDPVPQEPESPFTLQNILLFLVFAGVTGATGYMTVLRIKAKRSEFDDEDL